MTGGLQTTFELLGKERPARVTFGREVLATRGGIDHLIDVLDTDYQTLSQQVDARQLRISKERQEGLLLVRGFTHGIEQPLATLIDALAEEVTESERRLSEEDRRLFEEFVTGGLADHLHRRINEAKEVLLGRA